MHPSIAAIKHHGIPVGSYMTAIRHLMEKPDLNHSQYANMINDIVGRKVDVIADVRLTKYTFLYLVQESIRMSDSTDKLPMNDLFEKAKSKAEFYIANNPWVWAEPEDAEPKLDNQGNVKRKKGDKQTEAPRIYDEFIAQGKKVVIEKFMSELDMSKAGATTYFYNTKKKAEGQHG